LEWHEKKYETNFFVCSWYEVPFDEVVIGDYVWVDANTDGLQSTDPLERPLEGVVVSLFASNGVTLLGTTFD
jgi:hypothetical protein